MTILCDLGTRYASKLYNLDFLHGLSLPTPGWLERAGKIDPGYV